MVVEQDLGKMVASGSGVFETAVPLRYRVQMDSSVSLRLDEIEPYRDPLDNSNLDVDEFVDEMLLSIITNQKKSKNDDNSSDSSAKTLVKIPPEILDTVLNSLVKRIKQLDSKIQQDIVDGDKLFDPITSKRGLSSSSKEENKDPKTQISALYKRILEIQDRANNSEQLVSSVVKDIKVLDIAKRNLNKTTSLVNSLHVCCVGGVELKNAILKSDLSKANVVVSKLNSSKEHLLELSVQLKEAKEISHRLDILYTKLYDIIKNEFEVAINSNDLNNKQRMQTGCRTINSMGDNYKSRFIDWYCELELEPYKKMFGSDSELHGLSDMARRYSWIKRTLKTFDVQKSSIFLPEWDLAGELVSKFFIITTKDIHDILMNSRTSNNFDAKYIITALKETIDFESKIILRFPMKIRKGNKLEDYKFQFTGILSSIFEPYLIHYIEHNEKELLNLIQNYDKIHETSNPEDLIEDSIYKSATELFYEYRSYISIMAPLSTGKSFLDLSFMFGRCMSKYAEILQTKLQEATVVQQQTKPSSFSSIFNTHIPGITSSSSNASKSSNTQEKINGGDEDEEDSTTPTEVQAVIQKSAFVVKKDSIITVCRIINTAEYCSKMINSLEQKLLDTIDDSFKQFIDFQREIEGFNNVANKSVEKLISIYESQLDEPFLTMLRRSWKKISSVGDQSSHITMLVRIIENSFKLLDSNLVEDTKRYRYLCDVASEKVLNKYFQSIFKCRPVSEVGAEQMLLDINVLRSSLLNISVRAKEKNPRLSTSTPITTTPTLSRAKDSNIKPSNLYIKIVDRLISKSTKVLKVVMYKADKDNYETLISSFISLYSDVKDFDTESAKSYFIDGSETLEKHLSLILELKGLKRPVSDLIVNSYISKMNQLEPKHKTLEVHTNSNKDLSESENDDI